MSIFDSFRPQPQAADDEPLSTDDLMAMDDPMATGSSEPNPVMESGPDLPEGPEPEPHNVMDSPDSSLPEEGPDFATEGDERAELRDFLLERAQAREQRSLEYQEQARQANGLPK